MISSDLVWQGFFQYRLESSDSVVWETMGTLALPWPLFIVTRKRSSKTPLLTSVVVRLFFSAIYLFYTIVDLLMFLGMGLKNLLKDSRSHSWRNSFAYNNAILLQVGMGSKNLLKDSRSHSWRKSFAYNNATLLQVLQLSRGFHY